MNHSTTFLYRRALVTGGAGFIGTRIVAALVAAGCHTTVLDDLSSGSPANIPPGVDLIKEDVADARAVGLIEESAPQLVVHAAAQVSVPESMEDPERDRVVNLGGTRNVLEAARRAGTRRVVFLSSGGAIYASADGATEVTLPAPQSYYGIHKLAAEGYVALSGIPYANLRLANVYGPGQRPGLEGAVVAVFAQRLQAGLPIVIHGSGQQSRDFVHVDDVVSAVLMAAAAKANGTWNVATGTGTTIRELLRLAEDVFGRATQVAHGAPRAGDVDVSRLAASKIASDLGWKARYTVADGLRALSSERPRPEEREM